jgi:hypothetical protein
MSSAAETENVAPNPGNVHRHTFFYEVTLLGPTNTSNGAPAIKPVGVIAYNKRHTYYEFANNTFLGGSDTYLQTIVGNFFNMYKYYRYVKVTCHFKPFYNYAPLPNIWNVDYNIISGTLTPVGTYTINGDNQIASRSIRKILVNTDNTDWATVATLNYVRMLQTMTNTIRGTTIAEMSWSYVPKLMTPLLQDYQTQGTASQLRKVESGGQWLPTKYYTSGTATPAGFNPVVMQGFDLVIYDPAGRGAIFAENDYIGTLEFFVDMEFSILDDNAWIGTPPQSDSSLGVYVLYSGNTVSDDAQSDGS